MICPKCGTEHQEGRICDVRVKALVEQITRSELRMPTSRDALRRGFLRLCFNNPDKTVREMLALVEWDETRTREILLP